MSVLYVDHTFHRGTVSRAFEMSMAATRNPGAGLPYLELQELSDSMHWVER